MAHEILDKYPSVGSRIVTARELKGLSQSDLSRCLHTAQQNISRYESGRNDPKASILRDFCVQLDISPSYLLGLSDDPRPNEDLAQELTVEKVKLLDLWDRADDSARTFVLAGLSAVVDNIEGSVTTDGCPLK